MRNLPQVIFGFWLLLPLMGCSQDKGERNLQQLSTAEFSITSRVTDDFTNNRDWNQPSLFVGHDTDGSRISLRSFGTQVKLYVGGDIQYISTTGSDTKGYRGRAESIEMFADGGRMIQGLPKNVILKYLEPLIVEENGVAKLAVPFELADSAETISIKGTLIENSWESEFTVASYNVENLFDQVDDARNAKYGDYRITPNAQGQSSNWGDGVLVSGRKISFTDAKIMNIEKAITSIEPDGPAYINLQEIESEEGLHQLFLVMQKHGYVDFKFTKMTSDTETAIGLGIISKFPITNSELIPVPLPAGTPQAAQGTPPQILRPILKLSLAPRAGTTLTIYNNHWSSKGHPESYRIVYAQALEDNIQELLRQDTRADYIVTGDLNCDYNEAVILDQEHDDSHGRTGINSVLHAQGNESAVANGDLTKKYNLLYELPLGSRKSAWYPNTDWSSFDQVVIGTNMYDQTGYTYVDNSFNIASPTSQSQAFLFDSEGHPLRWRSKRVNNKLTKHELGGYSDHVPVSFRVYLPEPQTLRPIRLVKPGVPDQRDRPEN